MNHEKYTIIVKRVFYKFYSISFFAIETNILCYSFITVVASDQFITGINA